MKNVKTKKIKEVKGRFDLPLRWLAISKVFGVNRPPVNPKGIGNHHHLFQKK
jgi:hypothetical protein